MRAMGLCRQRKGIPPRRLVGMTRPLIGMDSLHYPFLGATGFGEGVYMDARAYRQPSKD